MKISFRLATGWSQDISNVFWQDVYVCVGFFHGKIHNGAFAGAQAWNQIKTEKGDLGGGLKKGNSVHQVYKRSARAPSHAASIAFPLCANYLICAVPNLQCYLYISLGPWQRFKVCSALPCRRGAARGQQHKQNSIGGPYHPPLWRCHSTEAQQACWAVEG